VCAVLAGASSVTAIADWLHDLDDIARARLGFLRAVPATTTMWRLLIRLDADLLATVLASWLHSRANPDVKAMLESGEVDLDALLPDWNRCSLALLKQTYLAACLTFGVLEGELADEIRRDLTAARDVENRRSVPTSRLASGLTIFRTYEPTTDEPAIRAVLHDPTGPVEGVLLVGRIFSPGPR
jgi:hypothetical protein